MDENPGPRICFLQKYGGHRVLAGGLQIGRIADGAVPSKLCPERIAPLCNTLATFSHHVTWTYTFAHVSFQAGKRHAVDVNLIGTVSAAA